jgi:hypothetical protein
MTLLQHTRQQIRHALIDADPSALRWWVTSLATASGWRDPASDQITSPGLQLFCHLHTGRGLQLFTAAITALPLPALASLALLASNLHGTRSDPSSRHHRLPPGTRHAAHPEPGTHPRSVHDLG